MGKNRIIIFLALAFAVLLAAGCSFHPGDTAAIEVDTGRSLTGTAAMTCGEYTSLALSTGGTLFGAGDNSIGQLGLGIPEDGNHLAWIGLMGSVKTMSSGWYHSLVVKKNGELWATGDNPHGQLGNGTTTKLISWTRVLTGVTAVAGGGSHSLALRTDGSVWGTGSNEYGQLGLGTVSSGSTNWIRLPFPTSSGVKAIAAGYSHSFVLRKDGTLWATGHNDGLLGNGDTANTCDWSFVLSNVRSIVAGFNHSLAIDENNILWATGSNANGQFGTGGTSGYTTWTSIRDNVTAAVAGFNYSLVITTDKNVWGAGFNREGQLGRGNKVSTNIWVRTNSFSTKSIAASPGWGFNSMALRDDGVLFVTGSNAFGQLGMRTINQYVIWTR
jgi:alpha-tubulin suppressor-like RCC1 family protein